MTRSYWKKISRKTLYKSKFIKLYEDDIELPNGNIIKDYTVIQKPDVVLIVATDKNGKLLVIKEYKYAVNSCLWTIPAGQMDENESSIIAAKRELLEETGYLSESFEEIGKLYEYPTKDTHEVHVVRAKNIIQTNELRREPTESVTEIKLISIDKLKNQIRKGEWKIGVVIAAFVLSGLFLKNNSASSYSCLVPTLK